MCSPIIKKKPKIIIHSQYYPPEIGAPQNRLSEIAVGLNQLGFHVIVLTAMPNYPKGRIFHGYGGLLQSEIADGVTILRTAIHPTQKAAFFPRLANYFSFVFSSLLVGTFLLPKADYLLTESPPLFLGISGYLLSRLKGARWIFNVSDLWPESAVRLGIINEGFLLKLSQKLESFCYQKAWCVTGQSQSILADIQSRFPRIQTFLLSNGVNIEVYPNSDQTNGLAVKKNNDVLALYAGLHGLAQGLDQVLLAAMRLNNVTRLKFRFVGDGPVKETLLKQASDLDLNNVEFLDPISKSEMPCLMQSADICLVPLKLYIPGAVPSKLYEAMAAGKPVILIADGEARQIVEKHQAGIVVSPGDIEGIVNALHKLTKDEELRHQLGKSGRLSAELYYNRQKIIGNFSNFLNENLD